jgi:hypothetical protein
VGGRLAGTSFDPAQSLPRVKPRGQARGAGRGQKTDDRRRRTENRLQTTDDGRDTNDDIRYTSNEICLAAVAGREEAYKELLGVE